MGEIVSRKKVFIDYSGGTYQLKRVKSSSITHSGTREVIAAMGVKGGAGTRKKEGGGEITLEVYRETGQPEVDYRALFDSDEFFTMVTQDEGGMREQHRSCQVAAIPDGKGDDAGDVMDTVKITFLQSSRLR